MTQQIRHFALLLLTLWPLTFQIQAARKPVMHPVYMFGFSASFTDSISCQTEVQKVDSAWLGAHKILIDRSLYGLQLQYHMESVENCKNPITTIFYDTSLRRLQRTWKRVRRRYERADGLRFSIIPVDRFLFRGEEYRPIIVDEPISNSKPHHSVTPPTSGEVVDEALQQGVDGAMKYADKKASKTHKKIKKDK